MMLRCVVKRKRKPGPGAIGVHKAMTTLPDFKKWLWSDWGKPNFLTRAGIPRIVTNFVAFWLAPYVSFLLTLRYAPAGDKPSIRLFVHEPLFLLAYAVLYVSMLADSFLEFSYKVNSFRPGERFRFVRQKWQDPIVKIFWMSLLSSMFLLLLGAFHFRHQVK
jgi:hypothetical protein